MSNNNTNTSNSWYTWGSVVDDAVLSDKELEMTSKVVFWALCTFATPQNRTCFPKVSTVADKIGVSVRTVQYALADLENRGVIRRQYNFDHSQPKERRQKTTTYYLIGHKAACYGGDEKMEDFYEESPIITLEDEPEQDILSDSTYATSCTPSVQQIAPQEVYQYKESYIPKGDESREEITNFDQQTQETIKADEIEDMEPKLDDVPSSMIHVAKYFLRETGRKQLLSEDISALREFAAHQVPARVMKAIDDKLKFFAAKGRPANTLSLAYIATVLRNQPTFSRDKGVLKKSQQKQEEAAIKEACRDLNARVITTSQTKWTAEEAQTALDKLNTMLAEMGEI